MKKILLDLTILTLLIGTFLLNSKANISSIITTGRQHAQTTVDKGHPGHFEGHGLSEFEHQLKHTQELQSKKRYKYEV